MSGWSAERVALCTANLGYGVTSAEDVWGFYWRWVLNHEPRSQYSISKEEVEIMRSVLREVGIYIEVGQEGKPLSRTIQPVTVVFLENWYPNAEDLEDIPLCLDYNRDARERSKSFLLQNANPRSIDHLTPVERPIVAAFGITAEYLVKSVLKLWARKMREDMSRIPLYRPINESDQSTVIMEFLATFMNEWQEMFGLIEETVQPGLGLDPTGTVVHITSTGYGTKILAGLLMVDRVQVIEIKRKVLSENIGFQFLPVEYLEKDCRSCSICQVSTGSAIVGAYDDELAVVNPEGITEVPVQMTICCGQIFGLICLKAWVAEAVNAQPARVPTCPMCRFKLPESFSRKLLAPIDDANGSQSDGSKIEVGGDEIQQSIGVANEETNAPIPADFQQGDPRSLELAHAAAVGLTIQAGIAVQRRRRRAPPPPVSAELPVIREPEVPMVEYLKPTSCFHNNDNFEAGPSLHRGNGERQDEFAMQG
ncbi:unnamed protein product [Diplocarpon coronariae]